MTQGRDFRRKRRSARGNTLDHWGVRRGEMRTQQHRKKPSLWQSHWQREQQDTWNERTAGAPERKMVQKSNETNKINEEPVKRRCTGKPWNICMGGRCLVSNLGNVFSMWLLILSQSGPRGSAQSAGSSHRKWCAEWIRQMRPDNNTSMCVEL